jgi:hypothetical protein
MPVTPNMSQLQSVGDFSLVLQHPLVAGGAAINLVGFKVEGNVLDSDQIMDNSKVVPLIGGIVVIITNRVKAGRLMFASVQTTGDPLQGDVVAVSQFLQNIGDNVGGTLRASWGQNGNTLSRTFTTACVKRVKPIIIMGNDVGEYAVEWTFGNYF